MKRNLINNSTIRNAKLCKENENFTHYTVFDQERNLKGWDVLENVALYGVSSGFLFLNSSTFSPAISRSQLLVSFDSSQFSQVKIRYKYKKNRSNSIASKGKIQFTTTADSIFNDTKSVEFDIIADGKWRNYTINMNPVETWVGLINNLKIFFAVDGAKDDEVFLEFIKIQAPVFDFCSDECELQDENTIYASNFLLSQLNTSPPEFSLVNVGTDRTITIQTNPSITLDASLFLNNTSTSFSGPRALFPFLEGAVVGYFSFRVRPVQGALSIKLLTNLMLNEVGFELIFDTDNIIKYRSTSILINEFEVPTSYEFNNWYDIFITFDTSINLFTVSINNTLVDDKVPAVFGGVLRGFSVENLLSNSFSYFDDFIFVEVLNSTVCTGIGRQGYLRGSRIDINKLDIVKNVNDLLVININNFGNTEIKIPEGIAYSLEAIRSLIQKKLTLLDLGGYNRATVTLLNNSFTIKSGTYGFDSSVSINSTPLSSQLGFDNATTELGRPHAAGFSFTNSFKEKSFLLENLKKEPESVDISSYYIHNPLLHELEVGALNSDLVTRRVLLDGRAKTIIDFTNRATNEGTITEIFFHGRLPRLPSIKVVGTDGFASGTIFSAINTNLEELEVLKGDTLRITTSDYIGVGEYIIESADGNVLTLKDNITLPFANNLTYEIFNISKVKHFRPKKDGTLVLINEQSIGIEQESRLYSTNPDSYKIDVEWYFHKGDLIGIYNAIDLYAGANDIELEEFTYLEINQDVIDFVSSDSIPKGENIYGVGLYGRSLNKQNRGALDIEFSDRSAIEYLEIKGRQLPEKRFYNLLTAVGTGVSFTANVSGTHVHRVENLFNGDIFDIVHDNIGYNVATLYDGLKYASNGLVGEFEQDTTDSKYFYISGDAEWGTTVEFPIPGGNLLLMSTFDYQEDPFSFEITWNSPKDIARLKMFFKEFPHAEGYFLEYQKKGFTNGDGTSDDFFLIGLDKEIEFTRVRLDKTTLTKESLDLEAALFRHFLPVYDGYVSNTNKSTIAPYQFYRRFPYNVLDKEFETVKTTGFKWNCLFHRSTKISELELFSVTDIESLLEDSVEVFFADENGKFFNAEPEIIDSETIRYRFHKPVKNIRIITTPSTTLELDYIYAGPLDDLIQYKDNTNTCIGSINIQPTLSGTSDIFELNIKNTLCKTADLEIDINENSLSNLVTLKSSLNSLESIKNPDIGPPGILYKNENLPVYVTENVALNSKTYGLKNIAGNKKVFQSINYQSESDSFVSVDGSKWEILYNQGNYPQLPVRTVNPGFRIEADVLDFPVNPLRAILRTKWHTTGSFNARVVAEVNSNWSNALEMGSFLGIEDSTGRRVFIESVRTFFTGGFTGNRVKFSFRIVDTNFGNLDEQILFGNGNFGTPNIGSNPDTTPYYLNLQRIFNPAGAINVLRFSYLDTVNNITNTNLQWGTDEYFELDINSLGLVGQIKIITGNYWTSSTLFALNHSLGGIPYAEIKHFFFGGQSSYTLRNIVFDANFINSGPNGEVNITNEVTTSQITKAAAVDLEQIYSLDIFEIYSNVENNLWDRTRIQFSNSNVNDPNLVDWGNTTWLNTRWILFEETTVPPLSPNTTILEALRVYPDITVPVVAGFDWDFLGNILGDNDSTTVINQLNYPIIAIQLADKFSIGNYKLLNKELQEFPKGSNPYNGWGINSFYTLSEYQFNNLNSIIWNDWVEYKSDTKQIKPFKWIAFKNDTFNTLSGLNSLALDVSEFRASTLNLSSEGSGNFLDRVDFTEYPEWFNIKSPELINIAEVKDDDRNFEGFLFGATSGFDSLFLPNTQTLAIFDDREDTSATLAGASGFMWRLFGTFSGNEVDVLEEVTDENNNTFVLTETEIINNFNFETEEIIGFELEVPSKTASVPNTIIFQTLTGTDPNLDSSWEDFYIETDLATEINLTQGLEYSFNLNNPYIVLFEDSILTSGVRLLITESLPEDLNLSSLSISSFKVFQKPPNFNTQLNITSDPINRVGGRRSLKLSYLTGSNDSDSVIGTFTLNPDPLWSFQDYLGFYLKTNSLNIDWKNCFVRIGTNSEQFYEWSLESLKDLDLSDFTLIKLKFKNAQNQSNGNLDLRTPSIIDLEPLVNFKEGPLEYFEFILKPLNIVTSTIDVWLDKFEIIREDFNIPSRFNNTLYLNNSELIHFPLSNVSLRHGYLELIITPDWDSRGITTFKKEEAFTIFSIVNNFDESLSLYYHGRFGMVFSYTDNKDQNFVYNVGYLDSIKPFTPFKLGVLWNSTNKRFQGKPGANIRFYFNDQPFKDFDNPWFTNESKNNILIIGGKSPLSNVAFNAASFYDGVVGTYLQADVNSVTGGVENLLFSSVPVKTDFNVVKSIRDKILLSKDGVNFVSLNDISIPFTYLDVKHGEEVKIYIKIDFPQDKSNLIRETFLISRWKIK